MSAISVVGRALPRAVAWRAIATARGGLVFGLIAFGLSGCCNFGGYEPGIANRGYAPGHGPPTVQEESKSLSDFAEFRPQMPASA